MRAAEVYYKAMSAHAKSIDKTASFQRLAGMRVGNMPMAQIATHAEDDPKFISAKLKLAEMDREGPAMGNVDRLYSQMGESPDEIIVAHGGIPGMEQPLSNPQKDLVRDTFRQLFPYYLFTGVSLKKDSSLGPRVFSNDPADRLLWLAKGFEINLETFPWLDSVKDQQAMHLKLLQEGPFWPFSVSIVRRQADKKGKVREEYVYNRRTNKISLQEIPIESALGMGLQRARIRRPQMCDGTINNLQAVIESGIADTMYREFPNMLHHKAPQDMVAKIEKAITQVKKAYDEGSGYQGELKRAGKPFYVNFITFDVTACDHNVSSDVQRIYYEERDALTGKYGFTRVNMNAPVISGSGDKRKIAYSGPEKYGYEDHLGYGTASGRFNVVTSNQLAVTSALRESASTFLSWMPQVQDFESGDRLRLFSKTDDNLLLLFSQEDFDALANKEVVVQNMPIRFEANKEEGTKAVGPFLANQYRLLESNEVEVMHTLASYFVNIWSSEGGLVRDRETGKIVRRSNRVSSASAGLGFMLRHRDYASNPGLLQAVDDMLKVFKDELGISWNEAFPINANELDMVDELSQPDSFDAIKWLLKADPNIIHKLRWSADDLPLELRQELFIHIEPNEFNQLTGNALPSDDKQHPGSVSLPYTDQEIATHMEIVETLRKEYRKGASANINYEMIPATDVKEHLRHDTALADYAPIEFTRSPEEDDEK